jgi:hypothetical protein
MREVNALHSLAEAIASLLRAGRETSNRLASDHIADALTDIESAVVQVASFAVDVIRGDDE